MSISWKSSSFFSRCSQALLIFSLSQLIACGPQNSEALRLPDDPAEETAATTPEQPSIEEAALPPATAANLSDTDRESILQNYNYVDPNHIVPYKALSDALVYFHQNKSYFANQNYVSVINFAQSSKEKRFYIINMQTGQVWPIHVAHGKGSDPDHDGFATVFSNVSGSNASSLGAYKTAETYTGKHGLSLRLDGLFSTNSQARPRAIVIHGASYVQEANVIQGRSWGCPAVAMENIDAVIKYLKQGSLIWAVVDKGGTERPTTPNPPSVAPPASDSTYVMKALAWESSKYPERSQWSQYLQQLVMEDWSSLLKGADDMKDFCPPYNTLSNPERANVWAQLFVAMTKYESAYNPLSRMQETTMGTDPVTRKPVYSEGLLQLSYQDIQAWNFCKFDWSKDKNLSPTDPRKTILNPYINLHCGVGIMAKQVARKGLIKIGSGAYWAVLKTNSRYQKISAIESMVKALPLCH